MFRAEFKPAATSSTFHGLIKMEPDKDAAAPKMEKKSISEGYLMVMRESHTSKLAQQQNTMLFFLIIKSQQKNPSNQHHQSTPGHQRITTIIAGFYLASYVFVGDEVHAVSDGGDEHRVGDVIQCTKLVKRNALVDICDTIKVDIISILLLLDY